MLELFLFEMPQVDNYFALGIDFYSYREFVGRVNFGFTSIRAKSPHWRARDGFQALDDGDDFEASDVLDQLGKFHIFPSRPQWTVLINRDDHPIRECRKQMVGNHIQ